LGNDFSSIESSFNIAPHIPKRNSFFATNGAASLISEQLIIKALSDASLDVCQITTHDDDDKNRDDSLTAEQASKPSPA